MVRAIRFWGTAARLITDDPHNARGREARCVPTRRGRALFGEGRWDPYMEDPGTLWLLLAPRKSRLPVWWLAFNEFNAVEFAEDDLEAAVLALLDAVPEWHKPHPKSINEDISALLRTYSLRQDRPGPHRRHAGLPTARAQPAGPLPSDRSTPRSIRILAEGLICARVRNAALRGLKQCLPWDVPKAVAMAQACQFSYRSLHLRASRRRA